MKTIDIIIPTYNRKPFIVKNLEMLIEHIMVLNAKDYISIYVSDNASEDGTIDALKKIRDDTDVRIFLFSQKDNLGSGGNMFFLIQQTTADFIMLLGDDDYCDKGFLEKVIYYLNSSMGISTIIPNCYNTGTWKYRTPLGKDVIYNFPSSGLVFIRDSVIEQMKGFNYKNNYPQIYFVDCSVKKGKLVHILSDPIRVTIPPVRAWYYNNDLFLDSLFEHLVYLKIDYLRRICYEAFLVEDSTGSMIHLGAKGILTVWGALVKKNNATVITKLLFPIYVIIGVIKGIGRRTRLAVTNDKKRYIHEAN